jgi:predicted NAD-dependent protein-ADP-ribosyltransferase YbiA (DUF1768 family)
MSNLIWRDVPHNWKEIVVHNDTTISGFFGKYRWLSNFQPCNLPEGYPTVENAYMAEKIIPAERAYFLTCSAEEAKRNWQNFTPLEPKKWNSKKDAAMEKWLGYKFSPEWNPNLTQNLKETKGKKLIELNYWEDVYWGVDIKLGGKNKLGKLITKIRKKHE